MILTILNWCYISFIVIFFGIIGASFIRKLFGYDIESDLTWVIGVILTTVFAEIFSLFGKVGALANLVLILICLFNLVLQRKKIFNMWVEMSGYFKNHLYKTIIFIIVSFIVIIIFAVLGSQRAYHPDTDGYHAQAIRWIEDYGSVKGLGNLHNRLAYNSSFMCLQALLSWSWLINQSMHTLNGYFGCMVLIYIFAKIILPDKCDNKLKSSNLFLCVMAFYVCNKSTLSVIASPHTDMMALLLVLFVLYKWCKYYEAGIENEVPYGILCIVALFSVSVKLSTAMLLLLVLKPAIMIFKKKKYKELILFAIIGMLVIFPFFARNIILSGYLIYPYTVINCFNVDWKMLPYAVDFDRREIMAWGKGLNDVAKSGWNLKEWFPVWWIKQSILLKILVLCNILSMPFIIVKSILAMKCKQWDQLLLNMTAILLFTFWLFTAPLERYGIVFSFCIPCILAGSWKIRWNAKIDHMLNGLIVIYSFIFIVIRLLSSEEIALKRSSYYVFRECSEMKWENITVYIPVENGSAGYYYIPSTPYPKRLDYIELIGDCIGDGIKIKDEWKNSKINTYGYID